MLFHEIEPAVFHNEYVNCFAEEKDFFLGYRGSLVLAGEQDGRIVLPTVGEALTAYEKRSDSVFDNNSICGNFRFYRM